jgi:hypothetical protein
MMSIGILILGTFSEYGQSDCERNIQQFLECFYYLAFPTSQYQSKLSYYNLYKTKEKTPNHFQFANISNSTPCFSLAFVLFSSGLVGLSPFKLELHQGD